MKLGSKCYASKSDGEHHVKGCRPGRPLCRWRRRVRPSRQVCRCSFEHFPHRAGWCNGDNTPRAIRKSRPREHAAE